jgi:hypothetical protein
LSETLARFNLRALLARTLAADCLSPSREPPSEELLLEASAAKLPLPRATMKAQRRRWG